MNMSLKSECEAYCEAELKCGSNKKDEDESEY